MSITFTQYLLPDGKRKQLAIDMPKDVEDKANYLISKNCHFDIEILMTGMISMTCENPAIDEDNPILSIEISENGPGIDEHVTSLVNRAYDKMKGK